MILRIRVIKDVVKDMRTKVEYKDAFPLNAYTVKYTRNNIYQ